MTKGFVIHLARAEARRAQAQRLAAEFPGDGAIIDAVDGSAMSPAEVAAVYRPGLHMPHYPFDLRMAEIGCFLSHRAGWRRILDEGLPHGVVMEDDLAMDSGVFQRALRLAERHVERAGFIQFQVRPLPQDAELLEADGDIRLAATRVTPLRCSAQLISRAAAERLLAVTETFDRPVDTTIQMHWLTGIKPLSIAPSGMTDAAAALGGSTISSTGRKSLVERLSREWKRFAYRREIARLSVAANLRGGSGQW